jgi:adenylylsulfate kinase-like enzyme
VTRIEIRDPSLVVLVGAAGSGKSTFAARWFAPSEVLSSDAFREILTGDAADQRATKTAFSIIHREVTKRLAAGRTVVVDATNVEASARRQLLARASFAERAGRSRSSSPCRGTSYWRGTPPARAGSSTRTSSSVTWSDLT